jgi:surfeit locus 1 family protein
MAAAAEADEYRRVQLSGVLLDGSTTQVLASLDRGSGYWV